jgi:hypothetical protein
MTHCDEWRVVVSDNEVAFNCKTLLFVRDGCLDASKCFSQKLDPPSLVV